MRVHFGWMIIACLILMGCDMRSRDTAKTASTSKTIAGAKATASTAAVSAKSETSSSNSGPASRDDAGGAAAAGAGSVPIEAGVAKLTPENTTIQFVGTHVGPKPDPRTGVFQKFTGEAAVDENTKTLKSVNVEIQTPSLTTRIDKLTNHLNDTDFFDTRENPKASFVSTKIEPQGDGGQHSITGNLTLLKTTKEITFPATVRVDNGALTLKANFTIDRTEFGMDRLQQNVEKEVALTVVVGAKSELPPLAGG